MELKWIKDYLALVEQGSFSKAATTRFVTQPAFSRRIRSLEAWLGISLIDRNQYPMGFTPAGEAFIERAKQLSDSIYLSREQLRSMERSNNELTICSQHALAVSFFPNWVENFNRILSDTLIRLDTVDLHDGVESFLVGNSDFLLCYASIDLFHQLQRDDIESLCVGHDELIPVSLANKDGSPLFKAGEDSVLTMLSHPPQSFFGQLIASQCVSQLPGTTTLHHRYQSALSEGLKALVLKGQGIAFLPRSIIQHEIDNGDLVQLTNLLPSIPLEIKLFHLKLSESAQAKKLWQHLKNVNQI